MDDPGKNRRLSAVGGSRRHPYRLTVSTGDRGFESGFESISLQQGVRNKRGAGVPGVDRIAKTVVGGLPAPVIPQYLGELLAGELRALIGIEDAGLALGRWALPDSI
jgi:hypothetical protein